MSHFITSPWAKSIEGLKHGRKIASRRSEVRPARDEIKLNGAALTREVSKTPSSSWQASEDKCPLSATFANGVGLALLTVNQSVSSLIHQSIKQDGERSEMNILSDSRQILP